MSNSKIERVYRCWNDCVPQGCPSHTATLEYQSVSNAFHFNDGKGQDFYGQTPEYGALLSMVYELSGWRTEVSSMIKEADTTVNTATSPDSSQTEPVENASDAPEPLAQGGQTQ